MHFRSRRPSSPSAVSTAKVRRKRHSHSGHHRALQCEMLEDRRMLSITVDTLVDEADGSIVDGDVSLRDAIANAPDGD